MPSATPFVAATDTETVCDAPGTRVNVPPLVPKRMPSEASSATAAVNVFAVLERFVTWIELDLLRPEPVEIAPNDWLTGSSPSCRAGRRRHVEQPGADDQRVVGDQVCLRMA